MDSEADPDIEFIEKDSGMCSMGGSKGETPERAGNDSSEIVKRNEYDDEPDESFYERICGLSEMFPESVRNFSSKFTNYSIKTTKILYRFSCNTAWVVCTSSIILFAPVVFETERCQMEEMQRAQQRQVLLGPGSAISSSQATPGGAPALPALQR